MEPNEVKIGQRVRHLIVSECGVGTVLDLPTGVNPQVVVEWGGSYGKCAAYAENLILVEQPKTAGHIHAELMKQYAEDAAKSETPWKNWEFTYGSDNFWESADWHPSWDIGCKYRRKPKQKFIEFNGKKFEIFAEKPERGAEYWIVNVARHVNVHQYHYDSTFDADNFDINNCFKDEKTAKSFAEELKKIFNNVVES